MPKIYKGGPLEFIDMVGIEDAIKRERIQSLEAEIERLNERLKVLQELHGEGWFVFKSGARLTGLEALFGEVKS